LGGPVLQDAASGYECIAPKIDVKLYYAPVVIYVGNEFAPGTCGYQDVLTHEQRHLKAYMDHLPKVEKIVREAFAKRFEAKPLYAPSGTSMSALEHEISSSWMPFIKAEMAKVEVQQAEIDTPEEYARLGKACNGEIQAILQRRAGRAKTR
jgi:coproporphyrinogen III oxidase-like Fe-S oxidoreductase